MGAVAEGANVKGAYWIPEGVEEIEPGALIGCKIGTPHVPWTAHVHDCDQLAHHVFLLLTQLTLLHGRLLDRWLGV